MTRVSERSRSLCVVRAMFGLVLALCFSVLLAAFASSQAWAAETKAYALLYSKGTEKTLVLQRGNTPETAKYGSLVTTYSDIEAKSSYCKWKDQGASRIIVRDALHPTTMSWWFARAEKIEGLNKLDTSNVTQMDCLFYGCEKITSLDLSRFNTARVENMQSMFSGCRALATLNLSSFKTSRATNMVNMFYDCASLSSLDLSSFNTSNVTNMMAMFGSCCALKGLDVSHFDTSKVTNMMDMFASCSQLTTLDVSHFNTSRVGYMEGMFSRCDSLTSIDVSRFDTSQVTDMQSMFNGCKRLKRLDLSSFDTSKIGKDGVRWMLPGCVSLTHLTFGPRWFETLNATGLDTLNRTWYTPAGLVANLSARPTAGTYSTIPPSTSSSIGVTSVKVDQVSFSLDKIGATRQLTATVYPANASNRTVTWSSSNSRVATVTGSGLVKAVGTGVAIIEARTANGKAATAKVTVGASKPVAVQASSVKINQGAFTLTKKGASKQLSATVSPSNASSKAVTWSSSNTKVAKVSSSGKVTAVSSGSAIIAVKTSNGKTAKVKVTVKIVYPTKVSIATKAFTLTKKGATKTVKYSLSGKGITDKTVKWSSSNTKVAKVSSSGKVTAVSSGSAIIAVKTSNGKTAKVKVTVKISSASAGPTAGQTARDIFNQYNAYRKSKGLKQVAWDDGLATEAMKSAKECWQRGALVHTVKNRNKGLSDILQYASWQMKGSEAVAKWKASDGHRKMMQCKTATRAGVAAYKGSNGIWYYVIVYNFSGRNQDGN